MRVPVYYYQAKSFSFSGNICLVGRPAKSDKKPKPVGWISPAEFEDLIKRCIGELLEPAGSDRELEKRSGVSHPTINKLKQYAKLVAAGERPPETASLSLETLCQMQLALKEDLSSILGAISRKCQDLENEKKSQELSRRIAIGYVAPPVEEVLNESAKKKQPQLSKGKKPPKSAPPVRRVRP